MQQDSSLIADNPQEENQELNNKNSVANQVSTSVSSKPKSKKIVGLFLFVALLLFVGSVFAAYKAGQDNGEVVVYNSPDTARPDNTSAIDENKGDQTGIIREGEIKSPSPIKTPEPSVPISDIPANKNIVLDRYKCNGDKYTDYVLGYEINCPEGFWVITTKAEGSFFGDLPLKRQSFCEGGEVNPDNPNDCLKGNIEIWSNLDGKGGSCDDDHYETILVNGKQSGFCWIDDRSSFSRLSAGDTEHKFGKSDFWIAGSPSKTFTKDELFEMLKSFKSL